VYHEEADAMPKKEIRFHIEGTTPQKLPMARLAEYLSELSRLLGSPDHVHFLRVETGSAPCVIEVDQEYEQKVLDRAKNAASRRGPRDAVKASESLRALLKKDKCWAELKRENGEIEASYPLLREKNYETFGPFWQEGTIEGIVVRLGGIDETLPVHLVYEGRTYICNASREVVRALGPHIWGEPIRAYGRGKWYRNEQEIWEMQFFDIYRWEPLEPSTLSDSVKRLRAIPDNDLTSLPDPLSTMQRIRGGEE
jgi:hypothetical protein